MPKKTKAQLREERRQKKNIEKALALAAAAAAAAAAPAPDADVAAPASAPDRISLTDPPVTNNAASTSDADGVNEDSQNEVDLHNEKCESCGLGGELLCCDKCNLVYHIGGTTKRHRRG